MSTLLAPTGTTRQAAPRRALHRTPTPRWWRDATAAAGWAVLLAVVGLWVHGGGISSTTTLAGGLTSVGRLTGMVASALLLIQVVLMARVPVVERAWGQDRLVKTHRLVGFTSFTLIWVHIVLIWLGYAATSQLGVLGTLADLVLDYPGMLLAVAGTLALCLVVATSIRRARRRLRYESWHLIHLYGYLGAALVLPHQLWTGQEFLSSRAATIFWWGAWGVTAAAVVAYRLALPTWRSLRAPLRVVEVRASGEGASTVVVGGRGVAALRPRGGQFFQWRFLDGPGWTRAHPFSLSAAPDGRTLELTAAHVGDGTRRMARLEPGTRVLVEGPYGRLHDGVRTREAVLLLGGGIGIAPLRSLLEDLGHDVRDIVVVHRMRGPEDVLTRETRESADRAGARYLAVPGPRVRERRSWLPQAAGHLTDHEALLRLVPDVAHRDVFVCGAPGWMDAALAALRDSGVPGDQIHVEHFDL